MFDKKSSNKRHQKDPDIYFQTLGQESVDKGKENLTDGFAMSSITIQRLEYDHPDATTLRDAQQLEISPLRPAGFGVLASATIIPIFLVAYDGAEPVACGGLRPLADQVLPGQAEIKRMYVVPSRRGSSEDGVRVAEVILEALEGAAREQGWTVLRAQTSKAMAQARRFYEKFGYLPCEVLEGGEKSKYFVCYDKSLA